MSSESTVNVWAAVPSLTRRRAAPVVGTSTTFGSKEKSFIFTCDVSDASTLLVVVSATSSVSSSEQAGAARSVSAAMRQASRRSTRQTLLVEEPHEASRGGDAIGGLDELLDLVPVVDGVEAHADPAVAGDERRRRVPGPLDEGRSLRLVGPAGEAVLVHARERTAAHHECAMAAPVDLLHLGEPGERGDSPIHHCRPPRPAPAARTRAQSGILPQPSKVGFTRPGATEARRPASRSAPAPAPASRDHGS